jgi:hypothetical protein
MNIAVSTTAFEMKRSGKQVLVQNLGPGTLYVSFDPAVSSTSGIQLDVFDAIELPGASYGSIYFLSDSTADVRLLGGASLPEGVVAPTGPFIQEFLDDVALGVNPSGVWSYISADDPSSTKLVLSESSNAPINYSIALSSTDPDVGFNSNPVTGTIQPGNTDQSFFFTGTYTGSELTYPITAVVTLSSADAQFDGLTATKELTGSRTVAEFLGTDGPAVEGGSAVDLMWRVIISPTSDVTLNYSSSTPELSFTSGTILAGASGFFIPAGTVQLSDNGIDEDTLILTAVTSSADPNWDGLILTIAGLDNPVLVKEVEPVPSGTFTPAAFGETVMEGTDTIVVNYALAYTPSADVIVDLSFDNPDFTVSSSSLTFTTGNFATSQSVTITYSGVLSDSVTGVLTATVSASSADTSRVGDTDNITVRRYDP